MVGGGCYQGRTDRIPQMTSVETVQGRVSPPTEERENGKNQDHGQDLPGDGAGDLVGQGLQAGDQKLGQNEYDDGEHAIPQLDCDVPRGEVLARDGRFISADGGGEEFAPAPRPPR